MISVKIRNIRHKGLRRLYETGDGSRLDPSSVTKLTHMLAFLEAMASLEELRAPPKWKAHGLAGDRRGAWSLHVTANYRLTFRVDHDGVLEDLDIEDYH